MSEITPHLAGFALVWSALAFGFCAPGPTMLAVMGTGLSRGRAPAMWVAAGCTGGSVVWALLSGSALARLFPENSAELLALRIAAALYLAGIAIVMAREAMADRRERVPGLPGGPAALLTSGLAVSMTNLKGAIFWLAVAVVAVGPGVPYSAVGVLAAGVALISALGHGAYAVVFSSGRAMKLYDDWRRPVQAGLAAFFTGAGILVLLGSAHRI